MIAALADPRFWVGLFLMLVGIAIVHGALSIVIDVEMQRTLPDVLAGAGAGFVCGWWSRVA
jgi:hypothetical protein